MSILLSVCVARNELTTVFLSVVSLSLFSLFSSLFYLYSSLLFSSLLFSSILFSSLLVSSLYYGIMTTVCVIERYQHTQRHTTTSRQ